MSFDFALLFVIAAAITGTIWALDVLVFAQRRAAAIEGGGNAAAAAKEPIIVEYSRAFFPIILIVLLVRSFAYEPFRIPSSSMMPTLLEGDFILVNKYVYGLRLPVINAKIVEIGEAQRGDVVVFKLPSDPSLHYIKRLVGLPGDLVEYRNKEIYVNGERVPLSPNGIYQKGASEPLQIFDEQLGEVRHKVLHSPRRTRHSDRYFRMVVPEGQYFMMGDNRDHSRDSRFPDVGTIPEENLVGKAVRIWMNIGGEWNRIGDRID